MFLSLDTQRTCTPSIMCRRRPEHATAALSKGCMQTGANTKSPLPSTRAAETCTCSLKNCMAMRVREGTAMYRKTVDQAWKKNARSRRVWKNEASTKAQLPSTQDAEACTCSLKNEHGASLLYPSSQYCCSVLR